MSRKSRRTGTEPQPTPRIGRVVTVTSAATKDIERLPVEVQGRVQIVRNELLRYPDTTNLAEFKRLSGVLRGCYQCRAGQDYRVIFVIGPTTIEVIAVGNRKEVHEIATRRETPAARDPGFGKIDLKRYRRSLETVLRVSIARNLLRARRSSGLSIKELAFRLGTTPSAVLDVERGQLTVSRGYVLAVLRACDLPRTFPLKS